MIVKIKKLDEKAKIPFKTYESDFCYDLVAVSEEEIAPNVWKYGFGFALQIERDSEFIGRTITGMIPTEIRLNLRYSPLNLSIDIRPRSSIFKTGMILSNSAGTVDEDYTGEISAVFYHVNTSLPRYKVGDKVAQMKIGVTFPINFIEVNELKPTERGEGKHGSADKK